MLKFIENLYDVKIQRKYVCYIKNSVLYSKWAFPTAEGGYNLTYAEKINKAVLKEILAETKNYKTLLATPLPDLDKKYPEDLELAEKIVVHGLLRKDIFPNEEKLTFKTVKSKEDLILWGQTASQIYPYLSADFAYESFKADVGKKYADYFIFYKDGQAMGTAQVVRGGGCSLICFVGIVEKYRRQGLGTDLVKQVLNYEINNGHRNFMLSASEIGLIIYKKLGFEMKEIVYRYNLKKHP